VNIWEWVEEACDDLREAGHERLAYIVEELPGLVCGGHHEQAEALIPEGLALARGLDHPWLEIFLRHWLAQSRVVRRRDVTGGLEELIHLLDFAHGDRTAACPQSVCVTQDVCIAYGAIDGPGYAEERLAAASEAIARIDATWPCFHCLSTEHAAALLDAERYREAESYCRKQLGQASRGGASTLWYVKLQLADAMSLQGRHEEALGSLKSNSSAGMGEEERRLLDLHRARELAVVGKIAEAVAAQLEPTTLKPSEYVLWMRAEMAICSVLPERNTLSLGQVLRTFFKTLRNHGALYEQAVIGVAAAKLALARGSTVIAARCLDDIEAVVPQLRRPQRIVEELQSLRHSLQDAATLVTNEPAGLDALTEDPERNLELLQQLTGETASEGVVLARCEAYRATGFSEYARRELSELVTRDPEATQALDQLLRLMVADLDDAGMRSIVQAVGEAQRPRALFYQARLYQQQRRWQQAAEALEHARRLEPEVEVIAYELALSYRHLQRHEDALRILDALVSGETRLEGVDWERMVIATLLGQFEKVRDSARRLEFQFEGEGPIDEPYAYCDILIADAAGREEAHRAVRINPVVARIVQMYGPGVRSYYRDEILFEPVAVDPPPEEDEEDEESDERPVSRFRPIKVLRAGGYRTYDLDGIYPGETEVENLRVALSELGVVLVVRSSESYEIAPAAGESSVRGLYAYMAVPTEVRSADVLECVQSHIRRWPLPMTHRGLLRELDMNEELARQERWAEEVSL